MDSRTLKKYVEKQFSLNVLPNLMNFIRIPNLSPGFDPEWNTNGLLLKAANLISSFAKSLNIKNSEVTLLQDSPYTPLVFIDIQKAVSDNTYFGAQISIENIDFGDGVILANVSNRKWTYIW